MSLKNKLYDFFKSFFSIFHKKSGKEEKRLEDGNKSEGLEEAYLQEVLDEEAEKVDASRRTLTTKLYVMKQEIEILKSDFPVKYSEFMAKIQTIEENYKLEFEKSRKILTFEIDPEIDTMMIVEVERLEREIKKFINNELKAYILSKRLQILIVKLNILYNVSISYPRDTEKKKVISQVEHAKLSEASMVQELEESDYILNDTRLKERIITLISYVDYEIFKTVLRNSESQPDKIIEELACITEFNEFDFSDAFKAFVQDELSDLSDLLDLKGQGENNKYVDIYKKEISKFLAKATIFVDCKSKILDISFWKNLFYLESCVIAYLKQKGLEKENAKIRIIDRMDINVKENEVLTIPKTNAYLALIGAFSVSQDERVFLLIKLFKNLSDKITYKEIYFLAVLFDIIDVLKDTQSGLVKYIEKYINKYPYEARTIIGRKKYVKENLQKEEYLIIFNLDGDEDKISQTLEKLNLDYKIVNNSICINSFYFNGLDNVRSSFKIA